MFFSGLLGSLVDTDEFHMPIMYLAMSLICLESRGLVRNRNLESTRGYFLAVTAAHRELHRAVSLWPVCTTCSVGFSLEETYCPPRLPKDVFV